MLPFFRPNNFAFLYEYLSKLDFFGEGEVNYIFQKREELRNYASISLCI